MKGLTLANKIEFNIIISGTEEIKKAFNGLSNDLKKSADGIKKAFKELPANLEEISKITKSVERDLGQVGQTVSLLGASISGPLVLALNSAAKYSAVAATEVGRFQQTTLQFQSEIASSVAPVFSRLNDVLGRLFNAFKSIDRSIRDQIIQGALITGVFLTLSGVFTIIASKVIGLASNIASLASKFLLFAAANPVMLAVGATIVVLIALMVKFKGVADVALGTFQAMFIILENGFLTIKAAFESTIASMLETLTKFSKVIGKLPSLLGVVVREFGGQITQASESLRTMADEDLAKVAQKSQELSQILTTGQSSWAVGFDDLKTKVQEFFAALNGEEGTTSIQTFMDGFNLGLDEISSKLGNLGQIGGDVAKTLHTGLSSAISDTILGVKTAKEAFADFGKLIVKTIVDYAAQWVAFQVLAKGLALIGVAFATAQAAIVGAAWAPAAALASLATLGGNAAPAAAAMTSTVALGNLLAVPKFAEGAGGLKDDTLGMFNKREIVIPTTFSDAIKSGELSLSGGGGGAQGGNTIFDFSGANFNGITDTLVEQIFTKASENIKNRTLAFSSG